MLILINEQGVLINKSHYAAAIISSKAITIAPPNRDSCALVLTNYGATSNHLRSLC